LRLPSEEDTLGEENHLNLSEKVNYFYPFSKEGKGDDRKKILVGENPGWRIGSGGSLQGKKAVETDPEYTLQPSREGEETENLQFRSNRERVNQKGGFEERNSNTSAKRNKPSVPKKKRKSSCES